MPPHCQTLDGIGWVFGHLIDGTQAEYVRVPFVDNGLIPLPDGVTAEQAVMLSDILPRGYEIGFRHGAVKDGDVGAVVGAGPVGLASITTAGTAGARRVIAVDGNAFRLQTALDFGATDVVNIAEEPDVIAALKAMSEDGLDVDVAIEAVGIPATFSTCLDAIHPGGRVANVGVHGESVTFPIERDWINNITVTTGLVDAVTTEDLLADIQPGPSRRRSSRPTASPSPLSSRRTTSLPTPWTTTPSRWCSRPADSGPDGCGPRAVGTGPTLPSYCWQVTRPRGRGSPQPDRRGRTT
jgi:alcohol dehydrogenase